MSNLLYLSRADVEAVGLPMSRIIDALEKAFTDHGEGRVEMPPKPGIHTKDDAFIHAMPAWIPSMHAAGIKWVSGYPSNLDIGLPYISGLLMLNDPDTGLPIAVMDCTWVTGMRTGAATAVSATKLARPDSRSVGIVAAGVQGRCNLEALCCRFPVQTVRVYDVHRPTAERFAEELGPRFGVDITIVETAEQAVRDMDLVVTSGPILKQPTPTIPAGWLKPGAFACPLDFDSYWTGNAFAEADLLATDDHQQMQYYRHVGYFSQTPRPACDLGELMTGKHPGRTSEDQRCIAINLGCALDDMATAILLYEGAREQGIGVELPL